MLTISFLLPRHSGYHCLSRAGSRLAGGHAGWKQLSSDVWLQGLAFAISNAQVSRLGKEIWEQNQWKTHQSRAGFQFLYLTLRSKILLGGQEEGKQSDMKIVTPE